jgi:hypothetical protein
MRRTKVVLAVAAMMVAMLVALAAPAMANDKNERNDQHRTNISDDNCCNNERNHIDDDFGIFDDGDEDWWGFWGLAEVEVETENVGENNALEGECIVTDIDGDEEIEDWEIELTCFV